MGQVFRFGEFTLDPSRYLLKRADRVVRLEKRPMELLILLVEKHGELISREEVAKRLWGAEVFVDADQGINTAIRKVRMALRDDPEKPRFVETVIGKGYRFSATVSSNGGNLQPEVPGEATAPLPTPSRSAPDAPHPSQERTLPRSAKLFFVAVILLIVVSSGWFLYRRLRSREPKAGAIRSLAVLPMKNLSGDPSQEYLADGITEELIARLSGIHDLRVISRTSVMRFKSSQLSLPEISKSLGADALVEGSVIREGNHIRVHAQLIRGATDEHFWSETYDRDLPDILGLQSEVAQTIAVKVKATITGTEQQRLAAAHRIDPEAYQLYLKGLFALNNSSSRAGREESVRYFENAIKKDSAFAPAYVGLAAAHAELGTIMLGGHPEIERPEVTKAVLKALQLDPNLAEAHVLLGETAQAEWRWAEAEAEYERALELNPNDASVYAGLAQWQLCHGHFDEALGLAERAREFDVSGSSIWGTAWILFHARRYDEAIRELHSILDVRGDDAGALWLLGFTFIVKGQPKEAIPVLERAATLANRSPGYLDVLAAAYARAGRRNDALRLLSELKQRRKKEGYIPAASFIIVYVGLDDKEQAFAWLEQAYKERSAMLQYLKIHPLLDPLRNDPRFTDLVHRVGLSQN